MTAASTNAPSRPTPELLPVLYRVAGATLFAKLVEDTGVWHLARVEADLAQVQRLLPDQQLRTHYVAPLLNDKIGTVAELFAVARASLHASALVPHAPGPNKKNFDARLSFGTGIIALEVKHQRDAFPFNSPPKSVEGAGRLYEGMRPGVDHRFVDLPPMEGATQQVPGADIWRQALLEAATQLPQDIPAIIAVSVDAFGGFEDDVVAALVGDPQTVARQWPDGAITVREERLANGVFHLDSFKHVTGVWFFKLHPEVSTKEGFDHVSICVWALGVMNYNSTKDTLPPALTFGLPNVVSKERLLTTE
jgi:hypothetical protein